MFIFICINLQICFRYFESIDYFFINNFEFIWSKLIQKISQYKLFLSIFRLTRPCYKQGFGSGLRRIEYGCGPSEESESESEHQKKIQT